MCSFLLICINVMLDLYLNTVLLFFSPHYVYLINLIENVQKRFTKKLPGLQNKCYQDKLKLRNLESLEIRRLHADLILMYKIINSTIHVDLHNCVSISYSITRGNKYKLNKYHAKLDIQKYFLPLEQLIFGTFYIMILLAVKLLMIFLLN